MINQTEGFAYRTIPYNFSKADSFTMRLRGLMFRKRPLNKEGLWIIPCNSIHMCFMFFPIDVIFLDKNNKIVKLVKELRPWRMIPPVQEAYSVLELPVGTINHFSLEVDQHIDIS